MHPNPAFRQTPEADALAFAVDRGFGVLTVNGAGGPLAAHVPFELREGEAVLHLARSNAIARTSPPCAVVIVVSGPDAYGLARLVWGRGSGADTDLYRRAPARGAGAVAG